MPLFAANFRDCSRLRTLCQQMADTRASCSSRAKGRRALAVICLNLIGSCRKMQHSPKRNFPTFFMLFFCFGILKCHLNVLICPVCRKWKADWAFLRQPCAWLGPRQQSTVYLTPQYYHNPLVPWDCKCATKPRMRSLFFPTFSPFHLSSSFE